MAWDHHAEDSIIMHGRLQKGSGILALVVLIASCDEAAQQTPVGPTPSSSVIHDGADLAKQDLAAVQQFDVELELVGPIRLNAPIHIAVTIHANVSTTNAELRLVLPELEATRVSGWRPGQRAAMIPNSLPGTSASPVHAFEWRGAIMAGETVRHEGTVTVREPGYYRLIAGVVDRSGRPPVIDGRDVQPIATAEAWLLIERARLRCSSRVRARGA